MKKRTLAAKIAAVLLAVVLLLTTFPVTALAASFPYYNPSTGAAVTPDTNDKYTSTASCYKNVQWSILNASSTGTYANSGKTEIKLSKNPSSGMVLIGFDTTDASVAFRAFDNLSFYSVTSYGTKKSVDRKNLVLQRYNYAGLGRNIFVVRNIPNMQTEVSMSQPVVDNKRLSVKASILVMYPGSNEKVVFTDSSCKYFLDADYATRTFSYTSYSGSKFEDVIVSYNFVNEFQQGDAFEKDYTISAYYGESKRTYGKFDAKKYRYSSSAYSYKANMLDGKGRVVDTSNARYKGAFAGIECSGGHIKVYLNTAGANYYLDKYAGMENLDAKNLQDAIYPARAVVMAEGYNFIRRMNAACGTNHVTLPLADTEYSIRVYLNCGTIYKPSSRYFDLGAGNLTVSVPDPYGFAYWNNMNLVFNESITLGGSAWSKMSTNGLQGFINGRIIEYGAGFSTSLCTTSNYWEFCNIMFGAPKSLCHKIGLSNADPLGTNLNKDLGSGAISTCSEYVKLTLKK